MRGGVPATPPKRCILHVRWVASLSSDGVSSRFPFLQRRNSPHGTFSPGSVRQMFPLKGSGFPFRPSQLLGLGAVEGVRTDVCDVAMDDRHGREATAMAEHEVVDLTSPPGKTQAVICIDSDVESPTPAATTAVVACDSDSLAEDEEVRALFETRRKQDRAEAHAGATFQNLEDIENYLEERKEKAKAELSNGKTRSPAKRGRSETEQVKLDAKAKKAKEKEEKKEKMRAERLAAREAKKRANGYYKEAELTAVLDQTLASHAYGWQTMRYLQEKKLLYRIEPIPEMAPYRCVVWRRHAPRKFGEEERPGQQGSEERVRYMVVVMKAEEFSEEVDKDPALTMLLDCCCKGQPGSSLLLVVEGLEALLRKREREGYRRITDGRSAGDLFVRDKYEDALVDLTVHAGGVMYRCVRDSCEVAECIGQTHLSLAKQPYWKKKDFLDVAGGSKLLSTVDQQRLLEFQSQSQPASSSDMEGSHLATSSTVRPRLRAPCLDDGSVFLRVLHQLPRLGPQDAYAIALHYNHLGALLEWAHAATHSTVDGGPQRHGRVHGDGDAWESSLEEVAELRHGQGGASRRVGRANASRLRTWLTCEDPDAVLR